MDTVLKTMEPKGKDMFETFWKVCGTPNEFDCKFCPVKAVKQDRSCGYANLWSHVKQAHADYQAVIRCHLTKSGPMDRFVKTTGEMALRLHGWIRWVVMENLPLTFVESKHARAYSKLKPISTKTFRKYAKLLQDHVKMIIKEKLRAFGTFGLAIDGWTSGQEHFLAQFAMGIENDKPKEYLIACGVQEDIDENTVFVEGLHEESKLFGFTAEDIFDMVTNCLVGDYDVDVNVDNFSQIIEFIAGDNCSTNRRLCDLAEVPLLGCKNHRLHLAVQAFIGPEEKKNSLGELITAVSQDRALVNKVDQLMGQLKTLKNASLLRSKTQLCAERKNATRWWSIYKMLQKWINLKEYILQVESFPESVLDKIPTAAEQPQIAQLIASLADFESVAKSFQFSGDKQPNQEDARVLFDSLLAAYPAKADALRPYLAADAPIVNNPDFENALVKIQGGKESELTENEKYSVRIFKKRGAPPTVPEVRQLSFAERHSNKRQRTDVSAYRCTLHCKIDNNNCERLFSTAKYVMSPQRRCMDPDTLERLLFLKLNSELWDSPSVMQDILDKKEEGNIAGDTEDEDNAMVEVDT